MHTPTCWTGSDRPTICSDECGGPVTYTERIFRGVPYIWFECECSEGPYAAI